MGPRLRRHHYTLVAAIVLTVACVAAGCGSSSNVNVTAPSGTRCAITVSGAAATIPAAGGSGTLTVNAERECAWSARVESSWISLNTGQGQGPATLTYSVQPNPAGAERRGGVLVDEQRFEVRQEAVPCRYDLTPSAVELAAAGGAVEVSLAAPAACPWTAQRSQPWVGVEPAEGSGALRIRIVLGPNPGATRTGNVTIAGAVLSVRQLGTSAPPDEPCRNEIAPTRRATPAAGETLAVTIATPSSACAWTVSSDVSWIWLLDLDKGVGNGTVRVQVQVNTGAARTGTVRVAGQVLTVDQEAATVAACSYTIAPASRSVGAPGEEVPVEVRTTPGCAWTAASNTSWIAVASGGSGAGNGSARLLVAANGGAARSGTALIAGQSFTVEQAAAATCSYTIAPTSRSVGAPGDDVTVEVRTTAGCAWTASSNVSWIAVSSGASGSGNGSARLVIAANTGADRTGTALIAGQSFRVEQSAPAPCTYTIAPTGRSVGARAEDVTVEVRTAAGCAWTASSGVSWIAVASGGSGTGNGSVRLAVAANPGAVRTGAASIAGHSFAVEQAAAAPCTYRVKPDRYNAARGPDDVRIAVDTTAACQWTASSPVSWATIVEGASGAGQGTVRVLVGANAGEPRSATLMIAGEAFRLSQDGQCTVTIKPEYYNSGPGPDDIKLQVKADGGCAWTAASPVPWATIIEGAAGSGNGDVRIKIEPNAGPARTATLMIAGVPFALAQEARK